MTEPRTYTLSLLTNSLIPDTFEATSKIGGMFHVEIYRELEKEFAPCLADWHCRNGFVGEWLQQEVR